MDAFERLIELVPPNLRVLDVGVGGCEGENTSAHLIRRFKNYLGTNIKTSSDIERFLFNNPVEMVIEDYWAGTRKVDFLVLDMNIENNIRNWSDEGMEHAKKYLNPNGYLINYIMVTDNYGDPETPAQLREHRDKWWKSWHVRDLQAKLLSLPHLRLIGLEQEERRPEIYWALLRYEP